MTWPAPAAELQPVGLHPLSPSPLGMRAETLGLQIRGNRPQNVTSTYPLLSPRRRDFLGAPPQLHHFLPLDGVDMLFPQTCSQAPAPHLTKAAPSPPGDPLLPSDEEGWHRKHSKFSKISGYKINTSNLCFCALTMKSLKKK